jgi:hypothetical protein
MMVRDEEAILRETLEAVKPLIDRWAILDTGSTDQTPMIIEQVLGDVPGRLVRAVWTDFGHARTRMFDEARSECEGKGWALIIDADSTVIHNGRDALRDELGVADSQEVELRHGGASWWMHSLLNLEHPWRFHGPVHEAMIGEPYALVGEPVRSMRIEPRPGGARSKDPDKYLRDAEVLGRAKVSDPEWAPRWAFYEAQSYRDAGDDLRAVELYTARAEMVEGWAQERYVAWLQAGDAQQRLCAPLGTILDCWLSAFEVDPDRPEALVRCAGLLREGSRFRAAWLAARESLEVLGRGTPAGKLFVEVEAWGWRPWFEASVSAWWADEKQIGIEASARVLMDDSVPESVRARVQSNLAFYA